VAIKEGEGSMSEDETMEQRQARVHAEVHAMIRAMEIPPVLVAMVDQHNAKALDVVQSGLLETINGMISHESGDALGMAECGNRLVHLIKNLSEIETKVLVTTLFSRYAMALVRPYGTATAFAQALRDNQVPGYSEEEPLHDLPPL
jgi:hypothetical protein